MTVDDLYLTIAQDIVDAIDDQWSSAIVVFYREEDAGEFECVYKKDDSDSEHDFVVSYDAYKAFEELHQITTEHGHNTWNRAIFTLQSNGDFSIDFDSV
ncbi:antitoxin YezG family protein [Shewanella sp. NKUCC05_KAH]|uniref:immunity protein YezG family protein n=1 Tax=unclassified Shewanella TaxID=196818 RepID=UPI0018E37F84|nr:MULTISPECIES: immunity protein YezG family protein [unclassified Shewanella]MBI1676275.1 DUF600 family protein [Shewanella sp. DW31]MBW3527816.1 antitoxin YezG family protein [Shewanella sp. NKUCC05_KAH]